MGNLYLSELILHYSKLQSLKLEVLAFFQSPKESIEHYVIEKQAPIPFPVIADPEHQIYKLYGLTTSRWGYIRGVMRVGKFNQARKKGFNIGKVEGDRYLIPGDFLIDNLQIVRASYGSDITEHMPLNSIYKYLTTKD